jgi:purine nucleosidase
MKKFYIYVFGTFVFLLFSITLNAQSRVKVIFDSDYNSDCDDDNALAVLHALANLGEAEILGIVLSDPYARIDDARALNNYYNRPNIPIGKFDENTSTSLWNSTELYRKLLSESEDNSVVIITVGYLTCMDSLLRSGPDKYSTKTGVDLVKDKVVLWSCMGGDYPSGNEWNFNNYSESSSYAVANWPGRVIFSGFELGDNITSGGCGDGIGERCSRSSWDPTSVLAGVRDPLLYWNLDTTGYNYVFPNGENEWRSSPDSRHEYLIRESKFTNNQLVDVLNQLMCAPPVTTGGIDVVPASESIMVYPNLTTGLFHASFELDSEQTVKVRIYNMTGESAYNDAFPVNKYYIKDIDISHLTSGVYILNIQIGSRTLYYKIIKN